MERATSKASTQQTPGVIFAIVVAVNFTVALPALAQIARSADDNAIHRVVLVSLADRKLAVIEDGNIVAKFPVAVGAATSPSPTGKFQIVNRVSNPTYYHPGTVIPGGKDNPVGTRWIGLNQKGYGIHGTNAPKSVGHASSHGCIRLRNRDVERLFTMLRVGDVVEIHGECDEQVAEVFENRADDTTVADSQVPAQDGGQQEESSEVLNGVE